MFQALMAAQSLRGSAAELTKVIRCVKLLPHSQRAPSLVAGMERWSSLSQTVGSCTPLMWSLEHLTMATAVRVLRLLLRAARRPLRLQTMATAVRVLRLLLQAVRELHLLYLTETAVRVLLLLQRTIHVLLAELLWSLQLPSYLWRCSKVFGVSSLGKVTV